MVKRQVSIAGLMQTKRLTLSSPPLLNSLKLKSKNNNKRLHRPGIEPGSVPWQGTIPPLDHRCVSNVSWTHQFTVDLQYVRFSELKTSKIWLSQPHNLHLTFTSGSDHPALISDPTPLCRFAPTLAAPDRCFARRRYAQVHPELIPAVGEKIRRNNRPQVNIHNQISCLTRNCEF